MAYTDNISEAEALQMGKELYETYANFKADKGESVTTWDQLPEIEKQAWHCCGFVSLGFAQMTVNVAVGLTEDIKKRAQVILAKS